VQLVATLNGERTANIIAIVTIIKTATSLMELALMANVPSLLLEAVAK